MDLRKLKTLIDLVQNSGISELEISEGEEKIRIAKNLGAPAQTTYMVGAPAPQYAPAPAPAAAPAAPAVAAAPLRGILLVVGACVMFSLLDSVAKYLSQAHHPMMVAWARYVFHVVVMVAVFAPTMGRRLFVTMNCSGCHGGRAGGGMGPSLRDTDWIYGNSDADIFSSIAQGRAHGMPAWGTRLPLDSIWMLVAYVVSLRTPGEPDAPR